MGRNARGQSPLSPIIFLESRSVCSENFACGREHLQYRTHVSQLIDVDDRDRVYVLDYCYELSFSLRKYIVLDIYIFSLSLTIKGRFVMRDIRCQVSQVLNEKMQ